MRSVRVDRVSEHFCRFGHRRYQSSNISTRQYSRRAFFRPPHDATRNYNHRPRTLLMILSDHGRPVIVVLPGKINTTQNYRDQRFVAGRRHWRGEATTAPFDFRTDATFRFSRDDYSRNPPCLGINNLAFLTCNWVAWQVLWASENALSPFQASMQQPRLITQWLDWLETTKL